MVIPFVADLEALGEFRFDEVEDDGEVVEVELVLEEPFVTVSVLVLVGGISGGVGLVVAAGEISDLFATLAFAQWIGK